MSDELNGSPVATKQVGWAQGAELQARPDLGAEGQRAF